MELWSVRSGAMGPDRDIQFVTASGGVVLAHWEVGAGPPMVLTHNFLLSNAELEWGVPSLASFYSRLAERFRVIRFDPRQSGLSDRGTELEVTTSVMAEDIAAVSEACGLDRFVLMAVSTMGPVGIEYAVRYPGSLESLILCDTFPTLGTSEFANQVRGYSALGEIGGEELADSIWLRLAPPEDVEGMKALTRAARRLTSDEDDYTTDAVLGWDAEPILGQVSVPTLIIRSREQVAGSSLDEARRMAAGIQDAQLRTVDGKFAPYFADQKAVLEAIYAFMQLEDWEDQAQPTTPAGFRTVVFTDLVASTELISRLGDADGRAAIREAETAVGELATEHGGRVVKNLGDGSLVSFLSTAGALSFAQQLQQRFKEGQLQIRIGMAAGEPIEEDDDLHGAVVVQASRIVDHGEAGDIIVADSVRQLALGKGFSFESLGDSTLKGFPETVRLWRVTQNT